MNEYEQGLVSVIIPTYKRSDLLKNAIESVLSQTYKNIELLVVNDNNKGDIYSVSLYEILDGFDDKRLHLIEQTSHKNGAAARNAGILKSKGEFIAFLDDDDYWEVSKISRQVALLSKLDNSWGAVTCLMKLYKNGKLFMSNVPYRSGDILVDILDRKTSMGTGALLIRRTALDEVGYFDENLKRHQDLQLFARLASKYKIKLDKVYLHNREVRDNQNRPSPEELRGIKIAYFDSIRDILEQISKRDLKKVYIMHEFECAYAFIKAGKYSEGIKMALGVFKMPETFGLAINNIVKRIISTQFCVYLSKRFSPLKIQEDCNE